MIPEIYAKAFDTSEFDDIIKLLNNNNIPFIVEETKAIIDQLQVGFNPGFKCYLKIGSNDRTKVDELVSNAFSITYKDIPKNYYLLKYSDDELLEIITFKDEWSQYDFLIAKTILLERGINPDNITSERIKQIRLKNESEKEPSPRTWLYIGYTSAFLGGILGLVIGFTMWQSKRTLSDGSRIFDFEEKDRKQGKIITIIGLIFFILWTLTWIIFRI
jgi:hypothetical protein